MEQFDFFFLSALFQECRDIKAEAGEKGYNYIWSLSFASYGTDFLSTLYSKDNVRLEGISGKMRSKGEIKAHFLRVRAFLEEGAK